MEIHFLNRNSLSPYAEKHREEVSPMACARSHTMTLLCAAKVHSRICVCGKEQLEVAEWCLVSPRQVRNWIRKDTNISVMNLYSLADCPECKTDDLVISLPMPEGKE